MKNRLSTSFPEFGGSDSAVMFFGLLVNIGETTLTRTIPANAALVSVCQINRNTTFYLSKFSKIKRIRK